MMTRVLLIAALSLGSAVASAQSDADLIAQATLPLPEQLRGGATVVHR